METKALLYGLIGFFAGGLLVSLVVTLQKPEPSKDTTSMSQMSESLQGKTGDEFDKAFIVGMIEHHQGAIDMAKQAEKNAKHNEIKQLSRDIITAQDGEISTMKQWQAVWGYASTDNHEAMGH